MILLNRTKDKPGWPQEGIYITYNSELSNPAGWSKPKKIRNAAAWYPQVIGLDKGGTDKLAGKVARFFVGGVSDWEIVFDRHGPAKAGVEVTGLEPGLVGEYFKPERVEDRPDVSARQPTVKRVDARIDFAAGEEDFYVRWSGYIRVPKDGVYTFWLESDDGARLTIGGERVVDNSGLPPMERQPGEVRLKAGLHELRLEFFEHGGQAGCRLFRGDEIVPESALFHKGG